MFIPSWSEEDCETLMVDPKGELYIISKLHGGHGLIGHLPSSGWDTGSRVMVNTSGRLDINTNTNDPVGGDISPDGTEVIVKTHHNLYYWHVQDRNYLTALQQPPAEVEYHDEPQGEAVCWDVKGFGYYTLSEGVGQTLYYYSRYV